MAMIASIEIKEDKATLERGFKRCKNFKVGQRIQSLLLIQEQKFKRQVDLATYLGVGHSTLKTWIKQYKEFGYDSLVTIKSGGNYKGVISDALHKALEEKMNDSETPLLGYWHAVSWVKEHHNQDINYQTLRSYLIRNFQTKKKHPRKSHYKKDIETIEVFKKTS
jgi:transposase